MFIDVVLDVELKLVEEKLIVVVKFDNVDFDGKELIFKFVKKVSFVVFVWLLKWIVKIIFDFVKEKIGDVEDNRLGKLLGEVKVVVK